jgi:hypothetical protein
MRLRTTLVVQDDIQQRTVDLQLAVVLDEAQFPESVHEKADSRGSCADHFRQSLLTDPTNYGVGCTFILSLWIVLFVLGRAWAPRCFARAVHHEGPH